MGVLAGPSGFDAVFRNPTEGSRVCRIGVLTFGSVPRPVRLGCCGTSSDGVLVFFERRYVSSDCLGLGAGGLVSVVGSSNSSTPRSVVSVGAVAHNLASAGLAFAFSPSGFRLSAVVIFGESVTSCESGQLSAEISRAEGQKWLWAKVEWQVVRFAAGRFHVELLSQRRGSQRAREPKTRERDGVPEPGLAEGERRMILTGSRFRVAWSLARRRVPVKLCGATSSQRMFASEFGCPFGG